MWKMWCCIRPSAAFIPGGVWIFRTLCHNLEFGVRHSVVAALQAGRGQVLEKLIHDLVHEWLVEEPQV